MCFSGGLPTQYFLIFYQKNLETTGRERRVTKKTKMPRIDLNRVKKRTSGELQAAKEHMVQKSVKDSTGRTYASALNSLRRVLVVLRGSANADPLTITKDELAEVLANMGRMRGNDPCGAEKGSREDGSLADLPRRPRDHGVVRRRATKGEGLGEAVWDADHGASRRAEAAASS